MAHFKTHTEGGSWLGGGTEVPNCSEAARAMIGTALANIRRRIESCTLSGLDGLRQRMLDMLDCSLEIDCSGDDCNLREGRTPNRGEARVILYCPESQTQARLNAVLFHEMVHAAGGTELDAEALENHCYAGAGANMPGGPDWEKFEDDGGEFVIWDQSTGALAVKIVSGGSWVDPPDVTAGDALTPVFTKPPDTGGGSWI